MDLLDGESAAAPALVAATFRRAATVPRSNLSVKLSALYSQIHPADPEPPRKHLRAAAAHPAAGQRTRAFINLDMESYALKDLTVRVFKTLFAEPEFASAPACGLALQAYLRDCEADLRGLDRLGARAPAARDRAPGQRRLLGL